jgi:hypothetical protein
MFLLASILAIFLLLLYTGWQLLNLWGWYKTVARPARKPLDSDQPLPTVALLVPFRNEAANLPALAASLLAQDYPGDLELIFINDHSSDGGAELLPASVTVLQLADYLKGEPTVAHKKAALTYAISTSQADIIITTDADCHWPADRVSRIAQEFSCGADIVLAPVLISPTDGFCNAFQALDLAAYQFLTAATAHQGRPALANGANFAFRRELFEAVGGYQGVDHLPSGDDVLLLHKFYSRRASNQESRTENQESRISDTYLTSNNSYRGAITPRVTPDAASSRNDKRNPEAQTTSHPPPSTLHPPPPSTTYLPSASITTKPVPNWSALWRQRLRWAGKAGNYNNPKLSFAQALTFALSVAIVLSLLTLPLHLRPRIIIVIWFGKALVDLLCLWPVMNYFGQAQTMKWYPAAAFIYPFFLVGIGTAALLGFTTKWKGRR